MFFTEICPKIVKIPCNVTFLNFNEQCGTVLFRELIGIEFKKSFVPSIERLGGILVKIKTIFTVYGNFIGIHPTVWQ